MLAVPAEIQIMAHALSGRKFDSDFAEWFLPQYTRGRGIHNMAQLVHSATTFLIDLFCEVWNTLGQTKNEKPRLVIMKYTQCTLRNTKILI